MKLLDIISSYWSEILVFIAGCVGLAQVIVNSTKSPKDNEVLAAIIKFLQVVRLYPKDPS